MITCGHYVLIIDYKKINEQLYKGKIFTSSGAKTYSKVQKDDIVYFNPVGSITIPDDTLDIIAVKYSEMIIREERPLEKGGEIIGMESCDFRYKFDELKAKF